jgi:hypothetical protein
LNYVPVWTELIDEAIKWSQEEIDDDEELDTMLAKKLGEFILFEEGSSNPRLRRWEHNPCIP